LGKACRIVPSGRSRRRSVRGPVPINFRTRRRPFRSGAPCRTAAGKESRTSPRNRVSCTLSKDAPRITTFLLSELRRQVAVPRPSAVQPGGVGLRVEPQNDGLSPEFSERNVLSPVILDLKSGAWDPTGSMPLLLDGATWLIRESTIGQPGAASTLSLTAGSSESARSLGGTTSSVFPAQPLGGEALRAIAGSRPPPFADRSSSTERRTSRRQPGRDVAERSPPSAGGETLECTAE